MRKTIYRISVDCDYDESVVNPDNGRTVGGTDRKSESSEQSSLDSIVDDVFGSDE